MKKLILGLLLTASIYPVDFDVEITGNYRLENFEENAMPIEAKLSTSYGEDNFYTELSLIGSSTSETPLDLYRAYVELYKDNLTITLGRQMISWGSAYIFNGANAFNKIDIENPKAEPLGVDALKLKYNFTEFSRGELVAFDNGVDSNNFGARYTFLVGNFELMGNYINHKSELGGGMRTEDIILEFKGDYGIGIWSQYINKRIEGIDPVNSIVVGGDYSFDAKGNTLYTVAETFFTIDEDSTHFYLMYNYPLREDMTWQQSAVFDGKLDSYFISTNITYLYNDYVDLKLSYNHYDDFSGLGMTTTDTSHLEDEISLEIRAYI